MMYVEFNMTHPGLDAVCDTFTCISDEQVYIMKGVNDLVIMNILK